MLVFFKIAWVLVQYTVMLCLLASKDRRIVDGHRRVLAMAWQMGYRRLWAKLNSFRCCKSYISCCCLSPMLESGFWHLKTLDRNWQVWLSRVLREGCYCVDFLAKLGFSQADSVLVEWLFPPQRWLSSRLQFMTLLMLLTGSHAWCSLKVLNGLIPCRHSQKQCINLDVAFIALESFVYFQGICW